MLKFAYHTGAYYALTSLGLEKWAVMLPPPTAVADDIGRAVGRSTQNASNAVAGGKAALQDEPIMQYVKAMDGPPAAAQSPTSRWFRGEMMGQLDEARMLKDIRAQQAAAARAQPKMPSNVPTQPPPGATMAPPGRR